MKRLSILGFAAATALTMQAQETYLSTNFDAGIPSDYTNLDIDELGVGSGFSIPVSPNWFTNDICGANGKAAISTSRHNFNLATDNWLITPQLHIKSNEAVFSWDAKSVHYDLRDGYKIMISTTDNEPESFEEVFSVEKESYGWKHHVLPLEAYAGQNIYIAIVHNSTNKFLLAVDNFFAGVPSALAFDAKNTSRRFCGNTGTTPITGAIRNIGKTAKVTKITCTSGLRVLTQELKTTLLKANDELAFNFDLPVELNQTVPYQIDVVTEDGKTYPALTDSIICSYFPRTLLMEKATGLWCTNCPSVMGYMNRMKDSYRDEIIQIESHSTYLDHLKLSYAPYDDGMAVQNYPTIFFNRYQKQQTLSNEEKLQLALKEVTPAQVTAEATLKNNKIAVKTKINFGPEFDNSKDQYRIGFAIIEKHKQLPIAFQKSSISGARYEEFGLMSSPLDKDFLFLHNTVKGTESAFKGVAKSLPAHIAANSTHSYEGEVELPTQMDSLDNHRLVVFILDYFNTRLFNATEVKINKDATGISSVTEDALDITLHYNGNGWVLHMPTTAFYTLNITDASGKTVLQQKGNGKQCELSTRNWHRGAYLIHIEQNGKQNSRKIWVD